MSPLTLAASCAVVPLLLICWSSGGRLRHSPWPAVAVILWYGFQAARIAVGNVRAPREWDFACFWLYGHIAAAHQNLYDPAVFAGFHTPFALSDEFRAAVLNVGFPYPPPTAALFLALGSIDSVPLGLALWYAVQFAALAGAAWILGRTLFPAGGWRSAPFVLALILALPASLMNVYDAQTNFLLLLLVALALRGRARAAGAIWEVLAVWVKPYAVALLLLDLLRNKRRRLLVAAVTALASLAAAALLLGPAALSNYVLANPAAREPSFAFVEGVNQSLLAIVLRTHAVLPAHISAAHEPLYLAGAAILTAVTAVLCARATGAAEVAFAAMLLLGLIVYPGTLSSYGVVLVVPLAVLWRHREAFPGGPAGVAALVAVAVLLQSDLLQRGFASNLTLWAACGYLLAARGAVRDERSLRAGAAAARGATG